MRNSLFTKQRSHKKKIQHIKNFQHQFFHFSLRNIVFKWELFSTQKLEFRIQNLEFRNRELHLIKNYFFPPRHILFEILISYRETTYANRFTCIIFVKGFMSLHSHLPPFTFAYCEMQQRDSGWVCKYMSARSGPGNNPIGVRRTGGNVGIFANSRSAISAHLIRGNVMRRR